MHSKGLLDSNAPHILPLALINVLGNKPSSFRSPFSLCYNSSLWIRSAINLSEPGEVKNSSPSILWGGEGAGKGGSVSKQVRKSRKIRR